MRRVRGISFLLIFALAGCGGGGSSQPPLPPTPVPLPQPIGRIPSLDAGLWKILYSPNMPANPSPATVGWKFNFPSQNGVHYVVTDQPVLLRSSISMMISVTTSLSENTIFRYDTEPQNTCVSPAKVRLFFQRRGDDGSGQGEMEFYRWWSNKAEYTLAAGTATVTGDLTDLGAWTSVFGRTADTNPAAFQAALANVGAVGMTFGGGCFYGHGVYVSPGSAEFNLQSFSVN